MSRCPVDAALQAAHSRARGGAADSRCHGPAAVIGTGYADELVPLERTQPVPYAQGSGGMLRRIGMPWHAPRTAAASRRRAAAQ